MNGGNCINTTSLNISDIAALVPCYGDGGGNATQIHYNNGQVITKNCRLKTVLQKTARHFNTDLARMRQSCIAYLGSVITVPLLFTPTLALVPLKMRIPLCDNDPAFGYVNIDSIRETTATGNLKDSTLPKCEITLKGGSSVPSYFSLKVTEKKLKNGILMRDYFFSQRRWAADTGELMVMEKAGPDALDNLKRISGMLYELLVEKNKEG